LVAAFALLMLLAQTLGLLHGVVHSAAPVSAHFAAEARGAPPDVHQAAGGVGAEATGGGHGFFMHLFCGHLGDADCRAYDQLGHFDAVPGVTALTLPLVVTPFLFSILPGLATARWHALFQARGPPSHL
jgi:hypothetical protein